MSKRVFQDNEYFEQVDYLGRSLGYGRIVRLDCMANAYFDESYIIATSEGHIRTLSVYQMRAISAIEALALIPEFK